MLNKLYMNIRCRIDVKLTDIICLKIILNLIGMMKMLRKSLNGKMFESLIFNDTFFLQVYPNGNNKQEEGMYQYIVIFVHFQKKL